MAENVSVFFSRPILIRQPIEIRHIRRIDHEKKPTIIVILLLTLISVGCSASYKATPLPFKTPAAFPNMVNIEGSQIAAKAFVDAKETQEAFGFDILGAGMLPVQVAFDNQGTILLKL